ncbi:MAG: bifunctional folylpolyglutamate synthase/dihydrofolate synthase [Planctomycetota bacterium]|nr:bifunctional folylpolyglutamate synthase/dihydrofolate synthase [Planctomycetota bacterium]
MLNAKSSRRKGRAKNASPPEITTYPNAVRYLLERTDYERMRLVRYNEETFKLDRMRTMLEAMGNPHDQVRMVHVAGTVGKGSTVAMISSMLEGCGYAVGQYTSPHLLDVRERITINGHTINKNDFTSLMKQIADVAAKLELDPTFFELLTVLGFTYFAEQAVDIAVIETGLGGRLDSTNVITPEVTVFTQIDFDHMHILGRTLGEIASEKAGIIKRGVPVITFDQHEDVQKVICETAEKAGSPVRMINRDIEFSERFGVSDDLGPHTRVCVVTESSQFMHLPVPLPGEHQAINCALALSVIDTLKSSGFEFSEVPLHDGLASTKTPGRMELIWNQPRILVDGAHNAVALKALMRCVGAHVPYDSMVCVFGCCEDKDVHAMLEMIALGGDKIIFTKAKGNPRAADPEELQRQFCEISGKMNQVTKSLPEALDLASRAVSRDDLVCVTGSFYLVGEAKKYLAEVHRKKKSK